MSSPTSTVVGLVNKRGRLTHGRLVVAVSCPLTVLERSSGSDWWDVKVNFSQEGMERGLQRKEI